MNHTSFRRVGAVAELYPVRSCLVLSGPVYGAEAVRAVCATSGPQAGPAWGGVTRRAVLVRCTAPHQVGRSPAEEKQKHEHDGVSRTPLHRV